MRVLLDTNCLTDALRSEDFTLARKLEQAVEIWIPFVALAEIKAGFLVGSRTAENEGLLSKFLRLPGVAVLFADQETTDVYATPVPAPSSCRQDPNQRVWRNHAQSHQRIQTQSPNHGGRFK